jgi:hypothetical protein
MNPTEIRIKLRPKNYALPVKSISFADSAAGSAPSQVQAPGGDY